MGPLELVERRSPHPGCSTASGLPSVAPLPTDCLDQASSTPETSTQRQGGSQLRSLQCSALTHAAIPRLRSPGEQETHIPPQDNRHSCSHSLRGRPAQVFSSCPWTGGGPSWLCPGPPPDVSRGQRGLPGAPPSASAPATASV